LPPPAAPRPPVGACPPQRPPDRLPRPPLGGGEQGREGGPVMTIPDLVAVWTGRQAEKELPGFLFLGPGLYHGHELTLDARPVGSEDVLALVRGTAAALYEFRMWLRAA